jgi:hypothetical protein
MSEELRRKLVCDSCHSIDETAADEPLSEHLCRIGWTYEGVDEHKCYKCHEQDKKQAAVAAQDRAGSVPAVPDGYTLHERREGGRTWITVTNPCGARPRVMFSSRREAVDFCIKDAAKVVTVVDGMRIVTPAGGVVTRTHIANLSFDKE